MNKLVATLATTTALFAGSTLYLWQKLEDRETAVAAPGADAAVTLAPGTPGVAASGISPASARPGAAPTTVASAAKTTPGTPAANGAASAGGDVQREMMTPFAKDFLRQFDNPAQHASLLKAARAGLESQYSRLRDKLKLDTNTFNQLVDVLAEEQLEQQANYFRCLLTPDCDTSKMVPPRDHSDEYLALLGADKYEDFKGYRNAIPEWQSVVQLRGRLSEANYLNDSNAERLMSALSAERQRYVTESNQAGANLRGWGNGTGMVWYTGDGGVEEQLASATAYTERMRQSAAAILTAEQLRAFVQLQDEMLANLASYLHSQSGKAG
jgi:hypothetical protein